MASKAGKPILTLKQFMLKQEVKSLYRRLLKTIKKVPDASHRQELSNWVRSDFRHNAGLTDDVAIRMLVKYGEMCIREVETTINLAR